MTGLHDVLDDLASTVHEVDLTDRVATGLRRRRHRQRTAFAGVTAGVVAVASLVVVTRPTGDAVRVVAPPSATAPGAVAAEPLYDLVWLNVAPSGDAVLHGKRVDGTVDVLGGRMFAGAADLSPDGRRVAYWRADMVAIRDLTTGRETTYDVGPSISDIVWSPDGRTIAAMDGRKTSGYGAVYHGIVLLDVATGRVQRVEYEYRNAGLSWSPDGSMLAVTLPGYNGVDLLTRTGTRVRRFTFDSYAWLASNHAWSPDGANLLVRIDSDDRSRSYTAVVSATTGAEVGRLVPPRPYVWRDADHVACECADGVISERTLDGTVTRTLLRFPEGVWAAEMLVRTGP